MSEREQLLLVSWICFVCAYLLRSWQYRRLKERHERACKRGTETFNEVSSAIDRMRRDLELRQERREAAAAKARKEREQAS